MDEECLGTRNLDPVLAAEPKPEPAVVGGRAEQRDQRLAQRVGRAQDGVHEGAPDTAALAVRADGQRPEREHGRPPDMPAGADHVPDHLTGADRHQRQAR